MRAKRNWKGNTGVVALALCCLFGIAQVVGLGATSNAAERDVVRLHLLWTNDVHGHIAAEPARFMNPEFPPPLGGGASAASYIKKVRREAAAAGEPVLLVDVGDMFQGTPIGTKTKGTAVIEYFNAVGYDLAVPGNHDFDLGRDNCQRLAEMSAFPWVCGNIIESETGELVDWCKPSLMIEKAGLKIGVIGICTPATKSMSFPDNIRGLDFLPMPESVAKFRDQLLDEGADLIFLAIHEGLPYDPTAGWKEIAAGETEATQTEQGTYGNASYGGMNVMELVNMVPGVDIAVCGHTHRGYREPWIDPLNHTLCFETYGNGSSIGHAVLLIDAETKELIGYDRSHDRGTIITLFEDEIWPDEEIAAIIRPWQEKTDAEMQKVVGQTAVNLARGGPGANLVGNLVTDAMREYFDADFSFQNLGGLRANLSAGDLTARDVFNVLPFGNELVVVEMDGKMLRRVIERKLRGNSSGICVSGVELEFDKTRPDYDRVVTLLIGGEPWDPDRTYRTVFTNYLLEGNSGLDFLTSIPLDQVLPSQIITADAVERYLQQYSPIRPRVDNRWVEKTGKEQAPYLARAYLPETE